jgi:nucleoside-diphosphate-sugar epimerase
MGDSDLVISGATGWIGRAFLSSYLKQRDTDCLTPFHAFSLSGAPIHIDGDLVIPSEPHRKLSPRNTHIRCFVPAAFITQDFLTSSDVQSYESSNRSLIDNAKEIVLSNQVECLINFSSGVVSSLSDRQKSRKPFLIYRDLKKMQEEVLSEVCQRMGTTFINCRVFSISGRYSKHPFKYAFFDLLRQFMSGDVVIASHNPVYRKYLDIEDVCSVLLEASKYKLDREFETDGEYIEIYDLAMRMKAILNFRGEVQRSSNVSEETDSYASTKNFISHFADSRGVVMKCLNTQIKTSYDWLLEQS